MFAYKKFVFIYKYLQVNYKNISIGTANKKKFITFHPISCNFSGPPKLLKCMLGISIVSFKQNNTHNYIQHN